MWYPCWQMNISYWGETFIGCNADLTTSCMVWFMDITVNFKPLTAHTVLIFYCSLQLFRVTFLSQHWSYCELSKHTPIYTSKQGICAHPLTLFTQLFIHTPDSWLVMMHICITSRTVFHYCLSALYCTIHLLDRNVRKNTGTDPCSGLPSHTGLDWKSTFICLEMCPACRAERATCQPLCTCVSAQQFWREIVWLELNCWLDQFSCEC